MHSKAVQCVLYYLRYLTPLLGTSLYKPYCLEVLFLNQQYPQFGPTVHLLEILGFYYA